MTADATTLLQSIENASRGLLYPSESDFPIEPIEFGEEEPTPEALLALRKLPSETRVDDPTLDAIFEGLTDVFEEASDDEQATSKRFQALKSLLEDNLEDIRIYRLGEVDMEIFVLGRHASGKWMGIRTNVVET